MKCLWERFFATQLGKPAGLFGRVYMTRFLNEGNQRSNELALGHLGARPTDRILEIGFGGGWLLRQLAGIATDGKVVGLDHSKTMVDSARGAFRAFGDKVELVCGSAEKLPFDAKSFDRVCTVHALYFWNDPKQAIREIHRVLRPGGTVVIGIHSKAKLETQPLTRHTFTLYAPEDVAALLAEASFEAVAVHSYDPDAWEDNHCIVARRPLESRGSPP